MSEMKKCRESRIIPAVIIILMIIGGMFSGVSARPINEGTAMDGEHSKSVFIRWSPQEESQVEGLRKNFQDNFKETLKEEIITEITEAMEPENYHQYPEWLVEALIADAGENPTHPPDEILEVETEVKISEDMLQFMKLSAPLGLSSRELDLLLEDTSFEGLGSYFREAARENEINELYLITEAMKEAKEHNPENNGTASAYVFGYREEWSSVEEAIAGGAKWLAVNKIHRAEKPRDTFFKEFWQQLQETDKTEGDPMEMESALTELKKNQQWQRETIREFYEVLNLFTYYLEIPEWDLEKIRDDETGSEWPVPGREIISSGFGPRNDPFEDEARFHKGMDIPGKPEDPIVAARSGVVTVSRKSGGYGNWIEIDHGDGWTTRYAHNLENLVEVGEEVIKGQEIALLGSTGRSTGPHLHFELRRKGKALDPLYWFN